MTKTKLIKDETGKEINENCLVTERVAAVYIGILSDTNKSCFALMSIDFLCKVKC